MSYLEISNLSKTLGKAEVIRGLNLAMDHGEFLVVFGPSGCGKTTLLRLIAGVIKADGGDVAIGGESMAEVEPEHRGVAMAFQSFALYPHFSAFENIASPLRADGLAESEVKKRVQEVADMLRIGHVLDHMPKELSNGQKQRTSLARSLIRRPRVLLLDDPLRNVDAKLRYEMRIELPEVLRQFETTVLYVTQDFKEAMALGDRVAVMLGGAIRQIDRPANIYRRPVDLDVARLFGDPPMNLLTTRAQRHNGSISVRFGETVLAAPDCPESLVDRECVVGVRPEDIHFLDAREPDSVPVRLEAVMPLNVRTAMLVKAPGDLLLTSSAWDIREARGEDNDTAVRIDLDQAVYFDPDSGQRVH